MRQVKFVMSSAIIMNWSAQGKITLWRPLFRGGFKRWPGGRRPCKSCGPPCGPPNKTVCKVAKLHNTCIYSMASHRWCQLTPFTQSCIMSSGILAHPQYRSGHPAGHPKLLQLETPLPLLPYGCRYKVSLPDRVKPSFVIYDIIKRQSARMSKIINDGLTLSGTLAQNAL